MADWTDTTILIASLAAGKAFTDEKAQALAENPEALLEASAAALVNQAIWHPYNKVTNGDANDGKIYDFAVDGAVLNVVSPDFVDGYEYRFRFDRVSSDTATVAALRAELYLETTAAYVFVANALPDDTASGNASGVMEVLQPREILTWVPVRGYAALTTTTGSITSTVSDVMSVHTTAQKRLRARFSYGGATTIDGGKIFMDRRRVII